MAQNGLKWLPVLAVQRDLGGGTERDFQDNGGHKIVSFRIQQSGAAKTEGGRGGIKKKKTEGEPENYSNKDF